MIPYHIADLQTLPTDVLTFSFLLKDVSISGKHCYSVALDEAHEMKTKLKTKNALIFFSQSSLATLTYDLPYRVETLHNFKTQLLFLEAERHSTSY